jgi:molybdopterin molybdotransferase
METGLSVAAAQERVLARFRRLPAETVDLIAALGRTLAADAVAARDLPPFTQSAMDGYAVRAQETAGGAAITPVRLRVIGSHAAGDAPTLTLMPGMAVSIATGAALPAGADAVVRIEETDGGTPMVAIRSSVSPGANVRRQGESVRRGTVVLRTGHILTAARVALLAAAGVAHPSIVRRPHVAILSTGNELVSVGQPLHAGQMGDVNSLMLAALVAESGGIAVPLGISRDTPEAFLAALSAAADADCIVTSGGVSVGAYDVVRTVLAAHGALDFWRVRMRPGGPVAFGTFGGVPVIALPGNPVAAFVAFALLARPVLARLLGRQPEIAPPLPARLTRPINGHVDVPLYLRAGLSITERGVDADTTIDQSVGNVATLATADALVLVPEGVRRIETGEIVSAIDLRT